MPLRGTMLRMFPRARRSNWPLNVEACVVRRLTLSRKTPAIAGTLRDTMADVPSAYRRSQPLFLLGEQFEQRAVEHTLRHFRHRLPAFRRDSIENAAKRDANIRQALIGAPLKHHGRRLDQLGNFVDRGGLHDSGSHVLDDGEEMEAREFGAGMCV